MPRRVDSAEVMQKRQRNRALQKQFHERKRDELLMLKKNQEKYRELKGKIDVQSKLLVLKVLQCKLSADIMHDILKRAELVY